MPLTNGELDRIRAELGYNVLNTAATPFVGVHAFFDQVLQPYLREGADTTSSTTVVAAPAGAFVTLSVASASGVVLHERVAVDVDDAFEMATVRSVSGTSVGVFLKKAHAGTYPVTVDGGLQIVRQCLAAISAAHELIAECDGTGAIKAVDEVHFYDSRGKSRLMLLNDQLEHWRNRLASAVGFPRNPASAPNGGACALY